MLKRTAQFCAMIILVLFLPFASHAQNQFGYPPGMVKSRFSAGPVISFYQNDPHFTANTKANFGYNVNYKLEIFLGGKPSFLIGLEYMHQGMQFNGYYSAPGNTYLFDKTFPYTHDIKYQELQLPIAFKIPFNIEKDNFYSPYVLVGIGYRYILKSTASIVSDSTQNTVYDGNTDLTFENHLINKHFNSFFEGGFGIQKNFREKGNAIFLEFTYKYSLSRLYYVGNITTNKILVRDADLSIDIGIRF